MVRLEYLCFIVKEPPMAITKEPVERRKNKRLLVRDAAFVCFDANPAMMARIVDTSTESNRAVVVGLFTGSFGIGINASLLVWGYIANLKGLGFMYLISGMVMFLAAAVAAWRLLATRTRPS